MGLVQVRQRVKTDHVHAYLRSGLCRCGKNPYLVEGELREALTKALKEIEDLNMVRWLTAWGWAICQTTL